MELAGLARHYDDIRSRNVVLMAVTADPPAVARGDVEKLGLPFPILSADGATLRRWGLFDDRGDIARPAWIILDAQGRVRRAWYPDSQRTGVSPEELVAAIRAS
jgi:peroxiredoxin